MQIWENNKNNNIGLHNFAYVSTQNKGTVYSSKAMTVTSGQLVDNN